MMREIIRTHRLICLAIGLVAMSLNACNKQSKTNEADTVAADTTKTSADTTTTEPVETNTNTEPANTNPRQAMMEGTVMMKGDAWIIQGTNKLSEMKDYFPSNLSAEFRVEGIRVEFQGVISEIPPNVRMVGVPITLTEIERIK